MKIVVTGGAGFVGSHLVDRLLNEGHEVIVLDNLVTGSKTNLSHLSNTSGFELIEQDVSKGIPNLGNVDVFYHLASPASPIDFEPLAIEILQVGSLGTMNGLNFAREKKAHFILASTSETYGDPLVHPQNEEYLGNVNQIGVRGVYDEAKRFSEAVTMAYRRKHGVKTSIVRIFNTYGPRMRANDGRVIPNFISQALRGNPLTVYGDGQQTRSLCFVSDLVDGLHRFMRFEPKLPINLGNDHEMTILSLAEETIRLTGSKSSTTFQPLPEGDPKLRCPVLDRAREFLKWEPKVSLQDGLQETINYFKKIL